MSYKILVKYLYYRMVLSIRSFLGSLLQFQKLIGISYHGLSVSNMYIIFFYMLYNISQVLVDVFSFL